MASTVSSSPVKSTKQSVAKPAGSNPVNKAPSVKPNQTQTQNPVGKDTVSLGRREDSAGNLSALTQGLADNFSLAETRPTTAESSTKALSLAKETAAGEDAKTTDPGQQSVDLARQFEGMLSQDVAGQLGDFGSAGRKTNNCADFVSSILAESGRGIERTESVSELRQQLLDQGWQVIPREEAQPGDVWMTESDTWGSRHTELVTTEGGTHTIGSNNISDTQQQITEREKEGGVIYGYRPEEE